MKSVLLLQKLSEIAQSRPSSNPVAFLNKVIEAQDLVLEMQRDHVGVLHENSRLRERLERSDRPVLLLREQTAA